MEIKNIPNPVLPDWVKLYNTYDPGYYAPGKRVSAEEWNSLFLASVRQGNYNADTLELLIKTYLPETYLTQVNFNQFSNEMRTAYSTFTNNIQEDFTEHKAQVQEQYDTFTTQVQEDFTALTSEVNSLEERVVKAEDVAYSLNDVIQEANEYAQAANQIAIEANTFAQEANDNASTALETANNAASVAASSNTTAQDALSAAQSAVTTANNAATHATQAVNTANAASLRAEDAIATANAAKTESAAAKNTAAQAETTANASNTTAESANDTASEAKRIAQNALDLVTEGQGSQVLVGGVAVAIFDADTKADLDYVDRQIAALVGAAPETLDTLEELATAFEENADVVKTLEAAIVTKVAKTDIEDFLSATSTNPVQNKVLYNPVIFAESERQKSKNLFRPIWWNKSENTYTTNGITFTYNPDDYSITINGTATSRATCYLNPEAFSNIGIGTYTFSGFNQKIGGSYIQAYNATDGKYPAFLYSGESSRTITWADQPNFTSLYISVDSGVTLDNLVLKMQAEEGSTATDWQFPYGSTVHKEDIQKNILTASLGADFYVSEINTYYNVPFSTSVISGNKLTLLSDGGIKINDTSVKKIKVSFTLGLYANSNMTVNAYATINRSISGGTQLNAINNIVFSTSGNYTLSASPRTLSVQNGDIIYLKYYTTNVGLCLNSNSNRTYMSVEVVE